MLNEIFKFCRKTCPHHCRPCHIPILNVPPFIFFHYRNRFTGAPPAAQSCQLGFSLYVNFAPPPSPPTLTLTPRHTPSLGKQELKKEVALIPPAYIERGILNKCCSKVCPPEPEKAEKWLLSFTCSLDRITPSVSTTCS